MKTILPLCLFLFTCSLGKAQHTFSVKEAKAYATEHSFQIKNIRFDKASAEQTIKETRAMGLPQINGTVDFTNFLDIPTSVAPADAFGFPDYITEYLVATSQASGIPINFPDPASQPEFSELQFGTKYNTSAGISVNQLLFDGVYFYGLKAAKAYREMVKIQENKTQEELEQAIEKAYYMVLIAQENIDLLSKNLILLDKTHLDTKGLFEQGFIEQQTVDQIELNKSAIENKLNNAKDQLKLSKLMLKFQMGIPATETIELTDKVKNMIVLTNNPPAFNAANLSEYKVVEYQEKLMTISKQADKSNAYPKLYGFLNHSQNAFSNSFGYKGVKWYPTTLLGVQLQVPIFSGFQLNAAMKKANIEIERTKALKTFTEEKLSLEYTQASTNYSSAITALSIAEKSLALAKSIEEKTLIKFKEGMVSSIDLTTTQGQSLSSQGAYISALLNLLNAKADIQKFNP